MNSTVRLPTDGGANSVGDTHDQSSPGLAVPEGRQSVRSLPRLRDKEANIVPKLMIWWISIIQVFRYTNTFNVLQIKIVCQMSYKYQTPKSNIVPEILHTYEATHFKFIGWNYRQRSKYYRCIHSYMRSNYQ